LWIKSNRKDSTSSRGFTSKAGGERSRHVAYRWGRFRGSNPTLTRAPHSGPALVQQTRRRKKPPPWSCHREVAVFLLPEPVHMPGGPPDRTTPAMAAKVTEPLWEIGDIVGVLEA